MSKWSVSKHQDGACGSHTYARVCSSCQYPIPETPPGGSPNGLKYRLPWQSQIFARKTLQGLFFLEKMQKINANPKMFESKNWWYHQKVLPKSVGFDNLNYFGQYFRVPPLVCRTCNNRLVLSSPLGSKRLLWSTFASRSGRRWSRPPISRKWSYCEVAH
jgi:hypothetical protein